MIEQGIYFALGGIVTALLALMFAPVFWHRALRLTRQRLQLQVPLSMQEILAERDQLRAEFAVEYLRVEQAMARVQATKDADAAEIGRGVMAKALLTEKVGDLTAVCDTQRMEIAHLSREAAEVGTSNATLQVGWHGIETDRDSWRERAENAQGRAAGLQAELGSARATIASLKIFSEGLEHRLTAAERDYIAREKAADENFRSRLETMVAQAAAHEAVGSGLRTELDIAANRIGDLEKEVANAKANLEKAARRETESDSAGIALRGELDDAIARIGQLQHEVENAKADLQRSAQRAKTAEAEFLSREQATAADAARHLESTTSLRAELADAKARVEELTAQLEVERASMALAREREKASHLSRGLQAEQARSADQAIGGRIELLETENATLQSALDAARRANSAVEAAGGTADADLRNTIHALGLAVAKMTKRAQAKTGTVDEDRVSRRKVELEANHPLGVA